MTQDQIVTAGRPANRLLAALPPEEWASLRPHLESVPLTLRQQLYAPGDALEHAYFPSRGVISLVSLMADGTVVEAATVGPEGMVGVPLFLDGETTSGCAMVQLAGDAVRIEAQEFRRAVAGSPGLRRLISRYTLALINLLSQNGACNATHVVEERCARWLLMAHDRVEHDTFPLTQEFLAQMLGVRRPTVTLTAGILQRAGLITYRRGSVTIVDREGLESASCECYRVIRDEFRRLVEPGGSA